YSIEKYGFMNPKKAKNDAILMNEQIRTNIINYLSNGYLAGGVLNLIAEYFLSNTTNISSVLIFSGILILFGFLLQAIHRTVKDTNIKDILTAVVLSLSIPIVTLRFINSASAAIWAFAFILLSVIFIFGNKIIQISITISIFLTQRSVWVMKPQVTIPVDATDHAARIGLYAIGIWFAFFANRVYTSKLQENESQISLQRFVSEISSDYISVNESSFYEKTHNMLTKLTGYLNTEQACIYLFDPDTEEFSSIYLSGSASAEDLITEIPTVNHSSSFIKQIKSNNMVRVSDIDQFPDEELSDMLPANGSEIKSLLALPVFNSGTVLGFLCITSVNRTKWQDSQIDFLKILSNLFADALAKVRQDKEINFMAFYDYLTGLPNRILFKDRVNQSLRSAGRSCKMVAIMFIDLDSFKTVNDAMGHDAGDGLIKQVAMELSRHVRKSDTVCRFGGDEFLVLLDDMESVQHIIQVAETITGLFNSPFFVNRQEIFVTASAGIAVFPTDGDDADILIKNADLAMYMAKEKGKNQFQICTPEMKDDVLLNMRLTTSLYRALEKDELKVCYQPVVHLEDKSIIGVEALVRWDHPELGMISPGKFIPLAEQTGLINSIGEWVLRTACQQLKEWQDASLPCFRIAVNVSINQFRNPGFVSLVRTIIRETGIDAENLELEVTESVAINESNYIVYVLDGLKDLGVSLSIDDFGTEYSSLSRLNSLPLDRLKIDIQFIRGINRTEKDQAVVLGIINLAHTLGLKVIAEGVENKAQLDFLIDNNCDEIQGFYFHPPMKPDEIEPAVRNF
ncbi:MAG: EAL domain-containing protein, partial [Clostridiales bacterium]|nr:EAL domain-containing protein [Clostridiales bacterium]